MLRNLQKSESRGEKDFRLLKQDESGLVRLPSSAGEGRGRGMGTRQRHLEGGCPFPHMLLCQEALALEQPEQL